MRWNSLWLSQVHPVCSWHTLRILRKSTASSTATCIHHLDCNSNSRATSQYICILQMSLIISVISIAYNVLHVYSVRSPLPHCSSLNFPRLLHQLWWFLKLYVIEMARACREYCRTLESLLFAYCFRENRVIQDSRTRSFHHSNPSH